MNFYYTDQAGEVIGPVSRAQLQQFVDADLLPPTTQVCYEGSEEWQPISAYIQRTKKPPTKAQPTPSQTAPSQTATVPARTSASPMKLFVAVFLAIVVAGGCLMAGWQLFLRDESAKPFTLSTSKANEGILERKGQLEGEVFVVTKGGQNYKLGLVATALYSLDTLKPYLDQKKKEADTELARLAPLIESAKAAKDSKETAERAAFEAELHANYSDPNRRPLEAAAEKARSERDAARNAYYDLLSERRHFLSGSYYFDALPEPIVTTQTNSDGKFAIEVPTKGQFAIAATAKRSVGDSTEHYYWLTQISLDGAPKKTIMLSNNNLTSEGSSDSLITTN